jgi:hypothetical protein
MHMCLCWGGGGKGGQVFCACMCTPCLSTGSMPHAPLQAKLHARLGQRMDAAFYHKMNLDRIDGEGASGQDAVDALTYLADYHKVCVCVCVCFGGVGWVGWRAWRGMQILWRKTANGAHGVR